MWEIFKWLFVCFRLLMFAVLGVILCITFPRWAVMLHKHVGQGLGKEYFGLWIEEE